MIITLKMLREDKVSNDSVTTLRRNRPVSGPWETRTHARLFWQQRSGWGAGTKPEALVIPALKGEPDKKVRAWLCHEFLIYFQHGPTGASCKWLLQLCGSVSFPGCFVRNSGLTFAIVGIIYFLSFNLIPWFKHLKRSHLGERKEGAWWITQGCLASKKGRKVLLQTGHKEKPGGSQVPGTL